MLMQSLVIVLTFYLLTLLYGHFSFIFHIGVMAVTDGSLDGARGVRGREDVYPHVECGALDWGHQGGESALAHGRLVEGLAHHNLGTLFNHLHIAHTGTYWLTREVATVDLTVGQQFHMAYCRGVILAVDADDTVITVLESHFIF